jgi:hypothetical protein
LEGIKRCFLILEGIDNGYPNYKKSKVSLCLEDPCTLNSTSSFVCSPLFSVNHNLTLPTLLKGTEIKFLMLPNIFPSFHLLSKALPVDAQIWFSLGLANLVIFHNSSNSKQIDTVIKELVEDNKVVAIEKWKLNENIITENSHQIFSSGIVNIENINLKLSSFLPLSIKFSVSEYIISVNKFLAASFKFTPHFYEGHKKTVETSSLLLVNDLSFIFGDFSFEPSTSLIYSFGKKTKEELIEVIKNRELLEKKEEIVNDRHGGLIQFVSSLSYLYSQGYSGTFPLFDHFGLVRRHSFLGVGSAISSLYELVMQIEETLDLLPFNSSKRATIYKSNIPQNYLGLFGDPSEYDNKIWKNDAVIKLINEETSNLSKESGLQKQSNGYYNRLAFYSGRLGFREYGFTATAAIQVLVESHSLEWNVINYTHEIIHNHVRIILNGNHLHIPHSIRNSDYSKWLNNKTLIIQNLYKNSNIAKDIIYDDFITLLLLQFCIFSQQFGNISTPSNRDLVENNRDTNITIPSNKQLTELIKHNYKDINEIFVHVIDFCYIYRKDINSYIQSIWASWATISSVINDLKQYIVRTLIIIGITIDGNSLNRFKESKAIFLTILETKLNTKKSYIYQKIKEILIIENEENDDLLLRFYNCIIIADTAFNFYTGKISLLLEKKDENIIEKYEEGITDDVSFSPIYDIETSKFSGKIIKSKIVFLFNQLMVEINNSQVQENIDDEEREKLSAWLLLSLSSFNKI